MNEKLDLLSPDITNLYTEADVNAAIEILTTVLLEVEAVSAPEIQRQPYQTATIPDDTVLLIALRRRQWYRIREECDQPNFRKFKDMLRTLRQGDNITASSTEKAQLVASSFSRAHTNQMPGTPAAVNDVNNSIGYVGRIPLTDDHAWLVGPKEIALLIRRLKSKKTPGQDQLRNIVLKQLPRKAHIFIAKIFSACVRPRGSMRW